MVVFSGLVRDHAEGTAGVTHIDYEAYAEQVLPRLGELAAEARRRWPELGRIVLWHREGRVAAERVLGGRRGLDPAPGRGVRGLPVRIDTLKATVPIWKKEFWDGGSEWAARQPAHHRRAHLRGPAGERSWRFLLIVVVVTVVGSLVVWLRHRKPTHFMSSVDDFQREMDALGRPSGSRRRVPRRNRPAAAAGPTAPTGGGSAWHATSPSTSAPPTPSSTCGGRASC